MASRGRGRGRGAKRTFNREQLNALGVVGNENHPQVLEPSPLFAPSQRNAGNLESSSNSDYALDMRHAFVNFVQLSYSYMKMPEQSKDVVRDKLEIPPKELAHDLRMFPSELRPKLKAKRKAKVPKKEENVVAKLERLEKLETKSTYNIDNVKTEPKAEEEEEEEDENAMEEDTIEEEMDDGTDYGNNYFDNGDSFCNDEDDNLDDGPVY